MEKFKKWIDHGVSITKIETGYSVFTVSTQHFICNSLDELTPERFELETVRHTEQQRKETELFSLAFGQLFY